MAPWAKNFFPWCFEASARWTENGLAVIALKRAQLVAVRVDADIVQRPRIVVRYLLQVVCWVMCCATRANVPWLGSVGAESIRRSRGCVRIFAGPRASLGLSVPFLHVRVSFTSMLLSRTLGCFAVKFNGKLGLNVAKKHSIITVVRVPYPLHRSLPAVRFPAAIVVCRSTAAVDDNRENNIRWKSKTISTCIISANFQHA